MSKNIQIGIIGPNTSLCSNELYLFGKKLGEKIATKNRVFISGGKGGFMKAVFEGIKSSTHTFSGQTVAILPEKDRSEANAFSDIVIPTGMDIARNLIIINSSDLLIAAGGGAGTLSELAFAWQQGKRVICIAGFGGWSERLSRDNIDARFDGLFLRAKGIDETVKLLDQNIKK